MSRTIVERKVYEIIEWEPEYVRHIRDLKICQHVELVYKGEVHKGWIHRLNPVKVEVKLYRGPMLRVDPFRLTPLETFHY